MIAAQLPIKAEKALYLGLAAIFIFQDQECLFLQETAVTSIQLDSRLEEVVDKKDYCTGREGPPMLVEDTVL